MKTHQAIINLSNQKKKKQRINQKLKQNVQSVADPHLQKIINRVRVPPKDHPNQMIACLREMVSSAMMMKMEVK